MPGPRDLNLPLRRIREIHRFVVWADRSESCLARQVDNPVGLHLRIAKASLWDFAYDQICRIIPFILQNLKEGAEGKDNVCTQM